MNQQPPPGYGHPPSAAGPAQPATPWYHGGLIVALSLLFCWPLGLILLWTSPRVSKTARIVGTAVFGGLGLVFTIASLLSKDKATPPPVSTASPQPASPNVSPTPVAEQTPKSLPARPVVSESCLELSRRFGASSKLSDLQKDELWKDYQGKGFTWPLRITEVSAGLLGGYTVQAKCAPESPSLIQDVHLSFDRDAKDYVMKLQKDETYTMSGTLKASSTLLGLTADGIPR
jgi:hypothetical protein